ncbi:MAG: hypothetical protein JXX28_06790 [Deltaproteobacteria bacterium]|nr:hypothetical protein [Deltaproteobacteria bacterium]
MRALPLLLSLTACGPSNLISECPKADTAEPDCSCEDSAPVEEIDPVWDGALLRVSAPQSGSFLPMESAGHFEAEVRDAAGNPLVWDDIAWSSSADPSWGPVGASFDDATLGVGRHDVYATTRLPNGDRLGWTVGGVLVQSLYAGTYTGTIYVELTVQNNGTPYTSSCAGATTIIVDMEGHAIAGDSTCLVSLMGADLQLSLLVDASNDAGAVDGEVALDLGFYQAGLPATGTLSEGGELLVDFSGDALGYAQVAGKVDATRISRDTALSAR